MLTGPASAFALSGPVTDTHAAASPTSLDASVTPRRTHLDHPVTVAGIAPAADAGHWAIVQTALSQQANWRYLASTQIAPGGYFRLRARLRHSGFVRVIDAATVASASSVSPSWSTSPAGPAVSAPVPVDVAAQFKVARRPRNVLNGQPVAVRGKLTPAQPGRSVRLQARLGDGWQTLAKGRTGRRGGFGLRYVAASGLQRPLRVLFTGDRANSRSAQTAGQVTVYTESTASWYEDAGNTGCGFRAELGVANRSLPCGTKVRFRYGGRSVTATVDDRGPYVGGRDWDLNQNTAAALGFAGVGTVWVSQ